MYGVIAASYKGGDIASYYICFLMSQQHGGNYTYIQKTARHDGPHAANITGSAYEAHIITYGFALKLRGAFLWVFIAKKHFSPNLLLFWCLWLCRNHYKESYNLSKF